MTACEREWLLCGSIDGSLCETECGFVSVCLCGFLCLSLWVIVLLVSVCEWWFGLVWECDVFKCFPRGQPPVGTVWNLALIFILVWSANTESWFIKVLLRTGKKVRMFYDVKAYIYRVVYRSLKYEVWSWFQPPRGPKYPKRSFAVNSYRDTY